MSVAVCEMTHYCQWVISNRIEAIQGLKYSHSVKYDCTLSLGWLFYQRQQELSALLTLLTVVQICRVQGWSALQFLTQAITQVLPATG